MTFYLVSFLLLSLSPSPSPSLPLCSALFSFSTPLLHLPSYKCTFNISPDNTLIPLIPFSKSQWNQWKQLFFSSPFLVNLSLSLSLSFIHSPSISAACYSTETFFHSSFFASSFTWDSFFPPLLHLPRRFCLPIIFRLLAGRSHWRERLAHKKDLFSLSFLKSCSGDETFNLSVLFFSLASSCR